MSNPILPSGTAEATSDAFTLSHGSPRTFTFLGSGAGVIQLQKVRPADPPIDVPDGALSAANAVVNVEGEGQYVWYRAAAETACGCE